MPNEAECRARLIDAAGQTILHLKTIITDWHEHPSDCFCYACNLRRSYLDIQVTAFSCNSNEAALSSPPTEAGAPSCPACDSPEPIEPHNHCTLSLEEWVQERLENCERHAELHGPEHRDGWLEDASYFRHILLELSSFTAKKLAAAPSPASREEAPSDAAIEEAVRVVDRMTCQGCAEDRQRYESSMFVGCVIHQMDDPIRPSRLCTAQGRAIVTAILPILRGGK